MDERLIENELFQTSHIMILICFTLFSGILAGESILLGWEIWAILLIMAGVVAGWIIHFRGRISEYARLWIYSALMMATYFFYGIHTTSTYDLSPVMTTVITLYTMTGVKKLITLCQATFFITFAYDIIGMVRSGAPFTPLEVTRTLLHIALIIMVGWVARVIIDRWGRVMGRVNREMAELKEGTEQLNDFLANMSHEIRTPVNVVMGFTGVCLEKETDEETRSHMESVMEAGRRINDQIGDILDYSEICRKSLAANCEDYTLASIVFDVSTQLSSVLNSSCELIIDVDPQVCAVMNSDSVKLRKILHHLLENGLKYTPEGGVYAHLYTVEEDYGVNLCIEVEDTGIGMGPKETEKSLLGFYQGDSSRTRKGGGLGLGLTVVQGFVSELGGFMMINSRVGEGTTVKVSLPQQVTDPGCCISLAEKEGLCMGVFIRFEKFGSAVVREYYGRLMTNIMSGLKINIHKAESPQELKRLCRSVRLSHLLTGREEYEENRDFIENLSKSVIVVVVAEEDFELGKDSLCIHSPKPITSFSVAEVLNLKHGIGNEVKTQLMITGIKALVVDDEPMNLSVARSVLGKYGMLIDTADSGYEAIERIGEKDYDVVFMDHMMPGMDGIETAERIWKSCGAQGRKKPAMVALTANAVSTAKEMFLSKGFDGFLSKPIELHELERVVNRVLSERNISEIPEITKEAETDTGEIYPGEPSGEHSGEPSGEHSGEPSGEHSDEPSAEPSDGKEGPHAGLVLAGVNVEDGLSYCENDEEFYISLLQQYASDSREKAQKIREAFEADDRKNYAVYVHSLKSTSKMLGMKELGERAKELEEIASEGSKIPEDMHESLLSGYRRVAEAITEEFGSEDGEPADTEGDVLEFEPESDNDVIFEFEAIPEDERR